MKFIHNKDGPRVILMVVAMMMIATFAIAVDKTSDINSQQAIVQTVADFGVIESLVVVNNLNSAPADGSVVFQTVHQSGYTVATASDAVGVNYSFTVFSNANGQFVNTLACGTTTVVLQFAILEQITPAIIRGADAVEIVVNATAFQATLFPEHVIIDTAFLMGFNDSNFTTKAHGDAGGVIRGGCQYLVVI